MSNYICEPLLAKNTFNIDLLKNLKSEMCGVRTIFADRGG